jgi:hypothetical protein
MKSHMFIFILSIRVSSFLILIKKFNMNNTDKNTLNKISESLNGSIPESVILVGLLAVSFGISWYIGTRIVSYSTSDSNPGSNPHSCPTDPDLGSGSDFTDSGWDSDYSDTNSSVSSDISPDVSNQGNSLYSVFNSVYESFSDSLCSISAGISSGISSVIKLGFKFGLMCWQNGGPMGPIGPIFFPMLIGLSVGLSVFIALNFTHNFLIIFYDPQVVIVEQTWKECNEKGLYSGLCLWCNLEYGFIKTSVVRVCEILAYLKMKLAYHFGRLSKWIFG